jgi:hypothetical protein
MNPLLNLTQKVFSKNGLNNSDFGKVSRKLQQTPYYPDVENWIKHNTKKRDLLEIPLPRTKTFGLPFYNNFNLWAPSFYSNLVSKKINKENLVYLFHIIEFMDMQDNIPKELSIHPNLSTPVKIKIDKSGKLISNLLNRYKLSSTRDFVFSKHNDLKI